jgi:hypothetical protein
MKACMACHGNSGTALGYCSQCHTYHDKSIECDKDRRPIEDLVGGQRDGLRGEQAGMGEEIAMERDNPGALPADEIVDSR